MPLRLKESHRVRSAPAVSAATSAPRATSFVGFPCLASEIVLMSISLGMYRTGRPRIDAANSPPRCDRYCRCSTVPLCTFGLARAMHGGAHDCFPAPDDALFHMAMRAPATALPAGSVFVMLDTINSSYFGFSYRPVPFRPRSRVSHDDPDDVTIRFRRLMTAGSDDVAGGIHIPRAESNLPRGLARPSYHHDRTGGQNDRNRVQDACVRVATASNRSHVCRTKRRRQP